MRNIGLLMMVVGGLVMAGCASAPSRYEIGYDNSASRAMNIWRASGMIGEMKDAKVPREKVVNFWDSNTGQLVGVANDVAMVNIGGGLNAGVVGGVGLALAVLGPDKHPERNSVFFWVKDTGQSEIEVREKIVDAFDSAVHEALIAQGAIPLQKSRAKNDYLVSVYNFKLPNNEYCTSAVGASGKENGVCYIGIKIPQLKKLDSGPASLGLNDGAYWEANATDNVTFPRIFFEANAAAKKDGLEKVYGNINQVAILQMVSEKMPSGFFIYSAPRKVESGKKESVKIPLIYENGKVEAFVVGE